MRRRYAGSGSAIGQVLLVCRYALAANPETSSSIRIPLGENGNNQENFRVCCNIDCGAEPVASGTPCTWGMNYRSVIGYGRARCIGDTGEKKHALQVCFGHYGRKTEEVGEFPPGNVSVVSIRIESMTGKESQR